MTFVITQGCCNDASCVSVCPVQCIRPRPGDPDFRSTEQLYIDPQVCIECGVCMDECPVDAIHPDYDLPEEQHEYLQINADYFAWTPITDWSSPDDRPRDLPASRPKLRVAIVGSGPSGCYAAGQLSEIDGVEVSVFDRLATPFGLVRAGVAPDHPRTKLIADDFDEILARPTVRCYFNVEVGEHISVDELLRHHHAVIYAAGADDDRQLGVPGEDLPGSYSAREFVGWYNGHPDHTELEFDLSSERVVVIGNGNVALDVARICALPPEYLDRTEMADHAIGALRNGATKEVIVAGRRGPLHGAYTTSELLQLSRSTDFDLVTSAEEAHTDPQVLSAHAPEGVSPQLARSLEIVSSSARREPTSDRRVVLRYLLSPMSINGNDRVESITFRRNEIVVEDGVIRVRDTGLTETMSTGLVLRAVGYRGSPSGFLPFDDTTGRVPNDAGRVMDPVSGRPVSGVYCAGWIKRGATGVIGTNKQCSAETVDTLLADFTANRLDDPKQGPDDLASLVAGRQPDAVDHASWTQIDQEERHRGARLGRARRKLVDLADMLDVSRVRVDHSR